MRLWVIASLLASLVMATAALTLEGTKGVAGLIWLALMVSVLSFVTAFSLLLARGVSSAHRRSLGRELERHYRDEGAEARDDPAGEHAVARRNLK